MLDLIIRNGHIVSANGIYEGDIAIKNDEIISIGHCFSDTKKVIDAKGCYVLPGLIDSHVHLKCSSWGAVSANDFKYGTVAAALGGVTTFIDFATQKRGSSMTEAIESHRKEIEGETRIDYCLHASITDDSPGTLSEIEKIIANGIPSFKMFMTYRSHGIMVDDEMMLRICQKINEFGGLPGVHAENDSIASANYSRFYKEGKLSPKYHALAKPDYVEAEAINRALFIAKIVNSPLYIYHLSTKSGIDLVRNAKLNNQKVFSETCLHYLCLTKNLLELPNGENYICSPPLRSIEDQEALWIALMDRTIDVISTDDAAFNAIDKRKALGGPIENIPNGLPGIGVRLPIIFTNGVSNGNLQIDRFVELNCENPAKIFGLYPRKGTLLPGSDADIVVIDPDRSILLNKQTQNMPVDWCPYEGLQVRGFPKYTIVRGKLLVDEYKFINNDFKGRFIPGKIERNLM